MAPPWIILHHNTFYPQHTLEAWRGIFLICTIAYAISAIVFILFGSAEVVSWDSPGRSSEEKDAEEKLEQDKKEARQIVGSLGVSVAGSVFCWFQIVNEIVMTILMDSWQLVQDYMITWLAPFYYGQHSLERQADTPSKVEGGNSEIRISIDEGCLSSDSGVDSPPVYDSTFEGQDRE